MVNNGSLHYDHDKDGTHTELAGCEANFSCACAHFSAYFFIFMVTHTSY